MKDTNATVIVDLKPSEKEIMNGLQKDARWGIGKAEREGLKVQESDDWKSFYAIYLQTMKDVGIKAETAEHVRENADVLFLCSKGEKIIGGSTLHVINGVPKLTRNASLKEYQKYQPNNLLYWTCILWSKKNGFEKLDLGGWQINARGHAVGVNKFKERWGSVVYFQKDYPLVKALGRKALRNFPRIKELRDKFRS